MRSGEDGLLMSRLNFTAAGEHELRYAKSVLKYEYVFSEE